MDQSDPIALWAEKLARLQTESNAIFSQIESSKHRKVTLDESYKNLEGLNLKEDELFRQSLRCVELEVFRGAHILAWCGFFDAILRLLGSDNFAALQAIRPNWSFSTKEELTESFTEHSIIEALKPLGITGKADQKALIGLLSRRNECAHPTDYFPDLNQTLGYISEIFSRLGKLQKRYPNLVLI